MAHCTNTLGPNYSCTLAAQTPFPAPYFAATMAKYVDPYAAHAGSAPHQPPPPAGYPPGAYPSGAYPPGTYPNDTTPSQQNYDVESASNANDGVIVGTASTSVRLGFLRKVYAILTLCFAVTVGIACVFSLVDPVRLFVVTHRWLVWVGLGVGIASFIFLVCTKPKRPWDSLVLGIFVLGFSFMIGVICAAYYQIGWGGVVLQAFIATAAIFLFITAYVLITKKDFSYLGGFLGAAIIALVAVSICTFVFQLVAQTRLSRWIYFAISIFGALIMSAYILYDTSLILHRYGPDDYVIAVASLYIDVTNLFMYMLSIFSLIQT